MVFHEARGYARPEGGLPPPSLSSRSLLLFLFWIWAWMWQLVYTIFGLMGLPRGMPGNDENNYYPRSYSSLRLFAFTDSRCARAYLRVCIDTYIDVYNTCAYMYVCVWYVDGQAYLSIVDINWSRNHCPVPRSHPWSANWQNPNSLVSPIKIRPHWRRTSSSAPAAWYRACCAACHWLGSQ